MFPVGLVAVGAFALTLGAIPARAQVTISGFGNGAGFTVNSNANGAAPTISGGTLTITNNVGNEARSVFYNTPVTVSTFSAEFVYQASGAKAADGIAFVIENDSRGVNARGGLGSGLGYGVSDDDATAIRESVAFEINIYNGHTRGINVQTGGAYTGAYNTTGTVAFNSGDQIKVNLAYNGTLLSATMLDLTTLQTYSTSYAIGSIATLLGASTGYVGFTGATGSQMSIQTISGFTFASVPEPSTTTLLALGVIGLATAGYRRRRS